MTVKYEDLASFSDEQSAWIQESGTYGKVNHSSSVADYPFALKPQFDGIIQKFLNKQTKAENPGKL